MKKRQAEKIACYYLNHKVGDKALHNTNTINIALKKHFGRFRKCAQRLKKIRFTQIKIRPMDWSNLFSKEKTG